MLLAAFALAVALFALTPGDAARAQSTPVVSVAPGAFPIKEGSDAEFTILASGAPSVNLDVSVTVSGGGNFGVTAGARAVTLPADAGVATLVVTTTDDAVAESADDVTVTVTSGAGYTVSSAHGSASVRVNDDDGGLNGPADLRAIGGYRLVGGNPSSKVLLTWDAPPDPPQVTDSDGNSVSAITGYELQESTEKDFSRFNTTKSFDADRRSYTGDRGSHPNFYLRFTSYFRIRALTGTGSAEVKGPWSPAVFATPSEFTNPNISGNVLNQEVFPPLAPAPVIVVPDETSLTVYWGIPSNRDGKGHTIVAYDLRYREGSSGGWTLVEDVWTYGSGILKHEIASLNQYSAYQLQVRAQSVIGHDNCKALEQVHTGGVTQSRCNLAHGAWSSAVAASPPPVYTIRAQVSDTDTTAVTEVTEGGSFYVAAPHRGTLPDQAQMRICTEGGQSFGIPLAAVCALNHSFLVDFGSFTQRTTNDKVDEPDDEYTFRLLADTWTRPRWTLGAPSSITVRILDDDKAPGQPTGVSVSPGQRALILGWSAPSDPGYSDGDDASHTDNAITAYDVRYIRSDATDEQRDDDSNWTLREDVWTAPGAGEDAPPLRYTISNLQNGVSYDVQVRAETQAGVGEWSLAATESPSATPPVYTIRAQVSETDTTAVTEVTEGGSFYVAVSHSSTLPTQAQMAICHEGAASFFEGHQGGICPYVFLVDFGSFYENTVNDKVDEPDDDHTFRLLSDHFSTPRWTLGAPSSITVRFLDDDKAPGQPTGVSVSPGNSALIVGWIAPSDPGYSDGTDETHVDNEVTWYDVRYIRTDAGDEEKGEDANWTVKEEAWSSEAGGGLRYVITGLSNGVSYDVQVRAETQAGVSEWSPVGTESPSETLPLISDYDRDDDGLIDVRTLGQLHAVRYDLDGDGTATRGSESDYAAAFPYAASRMGCPSTGCAGYELIGNLNFDTGTAGDRSDDTYHNGGAGWEPIKDFNATFEGNRKTIANLFISRAAERSVGLFGSTGSGSIIRNLHLSGVNVTGKHNVGGLAGESLGSVIDVAASGSISARRRAGGLVGKNGGSIGLSHSSATVTGSGHAGGLVGRNYGAILYSDATGSVTGTSTGSVEGIGGLVGANDGTIGASHAIGDVWANNGGGAGGLVGQNMRGASIIAAYATGDVVGDDDLGGLVGENRRGGRIIAAYATGDTSSTIEGFSVNVGGVLGKKDISNTFADLYWQETACDDIPGVVGSLAGVGSDDQNDNGVLDKGWVKTLSSGVREVQETATAGITCKTADELKGPTGYTGIYANWNVDVDGDGVVDDPWLFSNDQYQFYPHLIARPRQ